MKLVISLLVGYLLGTLSPAAFFGKLKKVNLREEGSKNLGASNAWITLGKGYFFAVMILDIFKSWLAAQIAWWAFPEVAVAGYVACIGAILGHIFPFYLHFKGGKGLAAFGGMVCTFNFWLLVFYLVFGFILIVIFNHSWIMPMVIGMTFPFVVLYFTKDWALFAVCLVGSIIIYITHFGNFLKAVRGTDFSTRELVGKRLKKKDGE